MIEPLEARVFLSATDLDLGFGQAGRAAAGDFGGNSRFADVALLPDGKILAVGTRSLLLSTDPNTGPVTADDFLVARYTAGGQLDTTFGGGDGFVVTDFGPAVPPPGVPAGTYDDQAAGVVLLPGGDFVVVGTAVQDAEFHGRFALARYNADGSLDTGFGGGDGLAAAAFPGLAYAGASAVAVSGGKLVVAGGAAGEQEPQRFALARYDAATGALDPTFGTGGVSAPQYFYYTLDFGGGAPPANIAASMAASDLAILPNGKILVGGTADVAYDNGLGSNSFALARYGANGALDATFGDEGFVTGIHGDGSVGDMAVRADGSVLLAGDRVYVDNLVSPTFSAARYTPAGALDRSFGAAGTGFVNAPFEPSTGESLDVARSTARSITLLPNGQVLLAGTLTTAIDTTSQSVRRLAMTRLNADGRPDATFGTNGRFTTDALATGEGAVFQPDGKVIFVGSFGPELNEQAGLVRFEAVGTGSVAGTVYDDANKNGTRDAGEPPLVGWTVYADGNNNGRVDAGEPLAVTGPTGAYTIAGLAPGSYRFREVRQDGWTRTQPAGAYPLGYYDLTVAAGQALTGNDFGNDLPDPAAPPTPNAAPVGVADSANGSQDAPLVVDVLANDTDDNGLDPGSVAVVTAPAHGTAAVNPVSGRITYVPAAGYSGADTFTYTVQDDAGLTSAPVTVSVTIAPATLGGTATAALPTTVIGGQKAKARVNVAVTNRSQAAVNGRVAVSTFLSRDGVLGDDDAPVSSYGKAMKLRPGQARTLKLGVNAFPAVSAGTYQVLARVTAPDGTTSVVPAGSLSVVAAYADLTATVTKAPAGPLARGGRATMNVAVRNIGNVAVAGTTSVKVYASADGTLDAAADRLVATVPAKLKLKPNGTNTYKVRFAVPADLATGPVTLIAVVDQESAIVERDDANNVAASSPLTIA